ncbi:hypothetical protein TUM19329_17790 [Legionella antarctica]|uniref:Glycine-rich protein n=1 Tax=Legionella antarctica TaxID=2708020 RepID=A0A6F8T4T6_9GAMM|nr:hypothetical protein [Legionella antarctica]BCA95418.1 hypothetical protein TUM19329_17790 [Legionella antarctica]
MNTYVKENVMRALVFTLCVLVSVCAGAYGGWRDGGWHGGGWYPAGGVTGSPYYGYTCQTISICHPSRGCWLQQSCN